MEKKAGKMISSAEKLPNGKKLTDNYEALNALSQSEEIKKLIAKLNKSDIASLQDVSGELAAEKLKKLIASPEGRELVKKVSEITGI